MKNPWKEISLMDYEHHMNQMMRGQLPTYPAYTMMILGIVEVMVCVIFSRGIF